VGRFACVCETDHVVMLQHILDVLYPPTCVSCQKAGEWLCEDCLASIYVEQKTEKLQGFSSVTVCGHYANPILRRVLTTFKYRSAYCLREVLGAILKRFRHEYVSPWPWARESSMTITPVPTDQRHVRERGFDHAAVCADVVREILVPWGTRDELLERVKQVTAQAALPADERRQANMKNTFVAKKCVTTPVLLVDDILTTGSTIQEAARALQEKGIQDIHVFVFARGT